MSAMPTVQANGLLNPFTGRKKWRIFCGNCGYTWDEKVPLVEPSRAICPACKAINTWSPAAFFREYEKHFQG